MFHSSGLYIQVSLLNTYSSFAVPAPAGLYSAHCFGKEGTGSWEMMELGVSATLYREEKPQVGEEGGVDQNIHFIILHSMRNKFNNQPSMQNNIYHCYEQITEFVK